MKTRIRQILTGAVALLAFRAVQGADFHVSTIQALQNALTIATNGTDTIWVTNGYYTGNFNYNGPSGENLVIQAEPGVTNLAIALDGGGLGRDLTLTNPGNGTFVIRGLTFIRNCGDSSRGALRVGTVAGAILVDNCRFLASGSGMGIEIVSGGSALVTNCAVIGAGGTGISILGVIGNVSVQSCTVATNFSNINNAGAGLLISGGGAVYVGGCSFLANSSSAAGSAGGFTWAGTTTLTLTNNAFTGNSAIGAGALVLSASGSAVISANTFTSNSGGAGALSSSAGAITLSGNYFTGNHASLFGGAAYLSQSAWLINGNTFASNSAAGTYGGALFCNSGFGTVSSNNFYGNSAYYEGGGARIIVQSAGSGSIVGNTFIGNFITYPTSSTGYGGGLECEGNSPASTISLTNNLFIGNSALSTSYGGGASCSAPTVTLCANTFLSNFAGAGGGLEVTGTKVTILDNLVARNFITGGGSWNGGGIYCSTTSNLLVVNNTIFANQAQGVGGGLACSISGTSEVLNVFNNIIWGNSATGSGADVWLAGTGLRKTFLYNDVHDMYGVWDIASNLLDLDPQFFDPVNGDYHLRPASPCVNSGTNGAPSLPGTDLDGNPRINAATVDLGCYEFNNSFFHPADTNNDWVISAAEYNAYASAWNSGQIWTTNPVVIPADFATRAGFLFLSGGAYTNDGSAQPICWKPRP